MRMHIRRKEEEEIYDCYTQALVRIYEGGGNWELNIWLAEIKSKNEQDEYRHSEFLAPDNLMLSAGLLPWYLSLIIPIQTHA